MLRIISILSIFISLQVSANELCNKPAGIERLTENTDIQFLVFGEIHGNKESPAIFAESVCAVAASGKKVVVGIEHDKSHQSSFDAFMHSDGVIGDEATFPLNTDVAIQRERSDGRTSIAMLDMLKKIRLLKQSGLDITVVPFVSFEGDLNDLNEDQTGYEKELARNILESSSKNEDAIVMILVGNVHALKSSFNGLNFEPMASHLPSESTISIYLQPTGGDSWNCQGNTCGVNEIQSKDSDDKHEFIINTLQTNNSEDQIHFDIIFNLGDVSASMPAALPK